MALPRLNQAPKQEGPSAEDLLKEKEVEIAEFKAKEAAREQAAREAEFNARLNAVETGPVMAPSAPAPDYNQALAAQEELNITDEELADPTRAKDAIVRIADYVAQQNRRADMQQIGGVMQSMAEQLADTKVATEVNRLSGKRFFQDLEGPLTKYFAQNKNLVFTPGAVERKYNELVGQYHDDLSAREQARKNPELDPELAPRSKEKEPPMRGGPGAERDRHEAPPKGKLDERRLKLMRSFNRAAGLNMDEEEWMGIEEGRLLPKKNSVDIQLGLQSPNVDYEE